MELQGKRVLIAGGAGLVGTNLIKRLLPTGAAIRATWHQRKPQVMYEGAGGPEYFRADLTREADCQAAVDGMDYVFMLATALGGAGVMSRDPLPLLGPNVRIYLNMIEAAYLARVKKLLFLGSSTAYPTSDSAVMEDEMFQGDPWDKYFLIGWHKRIGEKLCQIYSEKVKPAMPCVVLRPTNIYGPYDNFDLETSHVTAALIRKAVEGHNPLEVWGDGSELRDLLYVDDVIDAMLLAMERVEKYDPMNIGLGRVHSVKEILGAILIATGHYPNITFNLSKPTMIPKRLVNIEKARELLGWAPKTSLEEGIKQTVGWYVRQIK